jgi:hypothetical protein
MGANLNCCAQALPVASCAAAALRRCSVGVLDEELIVSIGAGQFVLPEKCCMCLGEPELMHECSTPGGKDGQSFVISIQVPICRDCRSRMKMKRTVIGLIAAVLIGGTVFAMWAMEGAWVPPWNWIGIVAFGLGAILVFVSMASQPAMVANDRVTFRNKDYQRLFDEVNGAGSERITQQA